MRSLDGIEAGIVIGEPAFEMWKKRASMVQEYLPDLPHGKLTPAAVPGMKLNVVVPGTT